MKNILIEYPKCSTCKKAKKWLEENNIKFEDRHIKRPVLVSDKEILIGFNEDKWNILK